MSRTGFYRRATLCVAALVLGVGGSSDAQSARTRTLLYDPTRPVAERLLPDDEKVVIHKIISRTPPHYQSPEFTEEIDRLASYDIIALVDVTSVQGLWIDNDTWLRTYVTGTVSRLLRGSRTLEDPVVFAHYNGEARLNGVRIVAGTYPVYQAGQRYLLFMLWDRSRDSYVVARGYNVTPEGALMYVHYSEPGAQPAPSALAGRQVEEVIDALLRAQK